MPYRFLFFLAFNLILKYAASQDTIPSWFYLKTADSINIYYRTFPNTEIRELKLKTTFKASATSVVSVIKNVEAMHKWSHTCKSTKLIKKVNNNELFYYYIADIPWPIQNRDVILHLKIFKDTINGIHTIISQNYNGLIPTNTGYTRISYMKAVWKITPISNKLTEMEYFITLKLSNNLPDWLINTAISYSPVKSINALKTIVEK